MEIISSNENVSWLRNFFLVELFKHLKVQLVVNCLKAVVVDSGGDCFKEQSHGSSEAPDLVIAQVYIENGYVSEAQGKYSIHVRQK